MNKFYLQLLPQTENKLKDDFVHIALKSYEHLEIDGTGFICISPECGTLRDLEESADLLIEELKAIKKEGIKFFKKT